MAVTRLSPGVYSNNGRVVQSTTKPGSGTTPASPAASGTTPAAAQSTGLYNPMQSQYLSNAEADLRGQVSRGGITQAQMDAEMGRLRGIASGPQFGSMPMNNSQDLMNAGLQWGSQTAQQGNMLTNANQYNPFGGQSVTYDPITGQPTVTQSLSKPNQDVVSGVQNSSMGANSALQSLLGGNAFGNVGGNTGQLSGYEQSVFDKLTNGMDVEKNRAIQNATQTLANRGIPVGSDAYKEEMNRVEKQFTDRSDNARSQAILQGNQQLLGSLGALSGIGQAGFYNPSFQPFQSAGYNPSVTDVFAAITGRDQNQQQIELQRQQLARARGGSGGGSSRGSSSPAFPIVSAPG